MEHRKELIEHLSCEITTHATNSMTFRSRLAFTVLIGPFVVMGSFLVATDGRVNSDAIEAIDARAVLAALGACVTYFGLGYYGARIDIHIMDQCNKWRRSLVDLANGAPITEVKIEFPHRGVRGYLLVFLLVLVAFFCIGYLMWGMLPLESPPLAP